MALFTLHSHHHIEWNGAQKQAAQTSTNISNNSSLCPISGYLFSAQFEPVVNVAHHFVTYCLLQQIDTQSVGSAFFTPVLGRSPPALS